MYPQLSTVVIRGNDSVVYMKIKTDKINKLHGVVFQDNKIYNTQTEVVCDGVLMKTFQDFSVWLQLEQPYTYIAVLEMVNGDLAGMPLKRLSLARV